MAGIYMIGPITGIDVVVPDHTYAVRVADIAGYGDTVMDAIRAFAREKNAIAHSLLNYPDGPYAVIQFPSKPS